jgi:hypothetical protein
MRYLAALERSIRRNGGHVYTGTHATTIEDGRHGGRALVGTQDGHSVTARDVVVATNVPIQDTLKLHTKQYPYRTYVIAARVPTGSVTHALYWDTAKPYHYVRLHRGGDRDLLLIGGEDHKTGQEPNGADPHERLEAWGRERFPAMREVVYRWSGQVIEPMDGLAFIGLNPGESTWIVTGDSGNGDAWRSRECSGELILGRDHLRASSTTRAARRCVRSATSRANPNMAAQYTSWFTGGDVDDVKQIPNGKARSFVTDSTNCRLPR